MKYINFTKEEQRKFMRLIKKKSNLTWESITHSLTISRSMVFFYLNGESKILKQNYEKLCSIANIRPRIKQYVVINNKTKEIRLPSKADNSLAEFIGILAGDGHLSQINYEISITCDSVTDKDYITNHVPKLIYKLFGLKASIQKSKYARAIKCRIYSKKLCEFLNKEYGIPIGKKKGQLHIPLQLQKNEGFLKSYLRGLFDTDGSLYFRRKSGKVISIISRDHSFLKEVKNALKQLNFSPSLSGKNLYIYNQEEINKFFSEIKPANSKHMKKYTNTISL